MSVQKMILLCVATLFLGDAAAAIKNVMLETPTANG